MRIKRKVQRLSIWLTYHFSCLHSHEHSMERFRSEYRLHEEIGRGGFGVVYRGFRAADGAPVAVKFVAHKYVREWTRHYEDASVAAEKKSTSGGRGGGQLVPAEMRYLQECADLDGVVDLVDWFASSKGFLMVMERPHSCMDLFDVVSVYGRLDEEIARCLFEQIVHTVVQLLQRHSIVHRDIKDENVIVDMDTGAIRLVDFGAADYLELARFKDFQGTKSYCPPEWFKRNCYLPLESTVWSLGVLLYIMLTGNNPFKNEIQICIGRPKFPDYISADSQDLIKQCLNPSPERRLALEDILKHKFFRSADSTATTLEKRSTSGSADTNADSGRGSMTNSFRRRTLGNSRRPFHALLRRRSMRHRRRRDCDNNRPDTEFDSESSSEAECSYRQSMNMECKNGPSPITVPQHILDAAARKGLPRQETNENSVYFTTDELDETSYRRATPNKLQESSSGFETAAEDPDDWTALPPEDSQCESFAGSYLSCRNAVSEMRRLQLFRIHDQKRVDSRAQLAVALSQSSYKSAVSDDANGMSLSSASSSSGAGTSEDDNGDDYEDGERVPSSAMAAAQAEAAEVSSTNLYFSAVEEGIQSALGSQPSTDFWSASDFDNDNGADETLRNDASNSIDVTIVVDDDEASANDVGDEVGDDELGDNGFNSQRLLAAPTPDSERDSITPTVPDALAAARSATPDSSTTLSPVPARYALHTPERAPSRQGHAAKSSTLSPPVRRRTQRRLSRRLRDAARHTPRKAESRSSSSDSLSSELSESAPVAPEDGRRERSAPCDVDRSTQVMVAASPTAVSSTTAAAQSGSRYRRRWRETMAARPSQTSQRNVTDMCRRLPPPSGDVDAVDGVGLNPISEQFFLNSLSCC